MDVRTERASGTTDNGIPSGRTDREWPTLSVIAPMYNEQEFLPRFAAGMQAQDYPPDRLEVLLIDGGSQDRTLEIAQTIARNDPRFRLLRNPERYLPQGENVGVRAARGEIIARADIHAAYPSDYLRCCVEALEQHDAWCIGGVLSTEPGGLTHIAAAIAIVQSHPFGVGNSYARIGRQARVVDSVAFPCLRRSVFQRVGLYNELMPRHEDVELYSRIRRAGGKLMVIPTIRATYYARASIRGLLKQAWYNGYETPIAWLTDRQCTQARHWIPGGFIATLIGLTVASGFAATPRWFLGAVTGAYFSALLIATIHVGVRRGWRYVPAAAAIFALHHFSYGLGTVVGALASLRAYRRVKAYRFPVLDQDTSE